MQLCLLPCAQLPYSPHTWSTPSSFPPHSQHPLSPFESSHYASDATGPKYALYPNSSTKQGSPHVQPGDQTQCVHCECPQTQSQCPQWWHLQRLLAVQSRCRADRLRRRVPWSVRRVVAGCGCRSLGCLCST